MAIYDVEFKEREIRVAAGNKRVASTVALEHVRTELGIPGWTQIPTITEVQFEVGDKMPALVGQP